MIAMVESVGIDIDTKMQWVLDAALRKCTDYGGEITLCTETGRGYHIRLRLPRPLPYLESFVVRLKLGDDPYRILFDMRRYVAGAMTGIDVLFDAKAIYSRPLG